jgi:hypothetical protein
MSTTPHSIPHLLPDTYILLIGRIAVAGARLEQRLHTTFSLLASEHPPTATGGRRHNVAIDVLLADDSLSQRIERLRLLAERTITYNGEKSTGAINRVVADDLAASLNGLVKRCEKARTTWDVDRDGTVTCTTTRARRLRTDTRTVTLHDLEQATREVENAASAVLNFHFDALSGTIHTDWGVMPGLEP